MCPQLPHHLGPLREPHEGAAGEDEFLGRAMMPGEVLKRLRMVEIAPGQFEARLLGGIDPSGRPLGSSEPI